MRPSRSARIVGIDVARFVALAGMMATHILPSFQRGTVEVTFVQSVAGGRASALFAVLAGVSLALTTGRTTPVRGRAFVAAALGIAVRAVLVAGIGLAVGAAGKDANIAVILTYYGVLFLLGIPFLVLRARWLYAAAGLWVVAGPVVSQLVRPHLAEPTFDSPTFASLEAAGRLLGDLTFTGFYPAVPWLAYLLVGLAIGRTDLTRWRTPAVLAVVGTVLAATAILVSDALLRRPGVRDLLADELAPFAFLEERLNNGFFGTTPTDSWWFLAVRAPHSGTPFDLAQTIGSAMLVIAACLVLGRLLPRVCAVVFGAGAMTLTLYSAHVLLRADEWDGDTPSTYFGQVAAAMVVGALFALARRRGPLEAIVGAASRLPRRLVFPHARESS